MKNNIKPQEKLYSLDKHTFSANLKDSFIDENYLDKVKIIEFCNCIDTWEQELLFSQNGFFSLKGKDVENKAEEFIRELEEFANAKVSEIKFLKPESKIAVKEIKRLKLDAISKQINKYKIQQLKEWEIEVYEQSLSVIKNKATLYKDDINIVQKSLKSALSVLELMSKQENWVEKTYKKKKEIYLSDFYSGIIDAFISEKNINAVKYFQSYSKYLFKEDKEKLEEKIKKLKVDVISYNWAKEIFSYDLSNDELEKEINNLKELIS